MNARSTNASFDPRPLHRQMSEMVVVWAYVLGLSTMLIVWATIAYNTIGSGSRTLPDYHLANPTPAAQPYNSINEYQRLRR